MDKGIIYSKDDSAEELFQIYTETESYKDIEIRFSLYLRFLDLKVNNNSISGENGNNKE